MLCIFRSQFRIVGKIPCLICYVLSLYIDFLLGLRPGPSSATLSRSLLHHMPRNFLESRLRKSYVSLSFWVFLPYLKLTAATPWVHFLMHQLTCSFAVQRLSPRIKICFFLRHSIGITWTSSSSILFQRSSRQHTCSPLLVCPFLVFISQQNTVMASCSCAQLLNNLKRTWVTDISFLSARTCFGNVYKDSSSCLPILLLSITLHLFCSSSKNSRSHTTCSSLLSHPALRPIRTCLEETEDGSFSNTTHCQNRPSIHPCSFALRERSIGI